ncbi:hypothetical protein OPIT5_29320 [Opitutaceae bacterium TAV5]|nr:hypothetical protein OPIT5_21800 [Opitutaceae bacterium TAV5]AHF94888.1 hypothetical protein OPIT5_29320 [Opitutaceae bacterium TAV5]
MNTSHSISADLFESYRRYRLQPVRQLNPLTLAHILDEFFWGQPREAALLWDKIERRDDRVRTAVAKRKRAVSALNWEIITDDDSPEATTQRADLEYFWGNLRATDMRCRDMTGGVDTYIRQVMGAIGFQYATHEILWRVSPGGRYTAELVAVPLWYFETESGRLRLLREPGAREGEDLDPRGWHVCASEESPLHEATAIAYTFKVTPLADWALKCEKFGIPWTVGKTNAQPNSPDWHAFARAVGGLGNNCAIVTNNESSVEINASAAGGEGPHPALVDRMDRAIVSLWLGGDLATMSQEGGANGSNPQKAGGDALLGGDIKFVTAQAEALSKKALELIHGAGVTPKAHFRLIAEADTDTTRELSVITTGVNHGVGVSVAHFREKFGLPAPASGEELLRPATPGAPAAAPAPSAAWNSAERADLAALARANAQDLAPLAARIAALDAAKTPEALADELAGLLRDFPALASQTLRSDAAANTLADAAEAAARAGLKAAGKTPETRAR